LRLVRLRSGPVQAIIHSSVGTRQPLWSKSFTRRAIFIFFMSFTEGIL
jgi:hypothetical protein